MAVWNISEIVRKKSLSQPLRSYMWRVALPKLTDSLNKTRVYGDGVGLARALENNNIDPHIDVSTRITSITIPGIAIDTEKAIDGNSFWYYAKHNDIGTITMEIQEYEDGLTLQYLKAWRSMMINSADEYKSYNPPAIYKHDIVFYRLTTNGQDLIKHTFRNFFISGLGDVVNDYENTTCVSYPATFTGDSVDYEIFDVATLKDRPEDKKILSDSLKFNKKLPNFDDVIKNVLS